MSYVCSRVRKFYRKLCCWRFKLSTAFVHFHRCSLGLVAVSWQRPNEPAYERSGGRNQLNWVRPPLRSRAYCARRTRRTPLVRIRLCLSGAFVRSLAGSIRLVEMKSKWISRVARLGPFVFASHTRLEDLPPAANKSLCAKAPACQQRQGFVSVRSIVYESGGVRASSGRMAVRNEIYDRGFLVRSRGRAFVRSVSFGFMRMIRRRRTVRFLFVKSKIGQVSYKAPEPKR